MIKEHIEAIQKEIKEKYGVTANVEIHVHNSFQSIDLSKATEIVCDIQPAIGAKIEVSHSENFKWLSCNNWSNRILLNVWYEGEA